MIRRASYSKQKSSGEPLVSDPSMVDLLSKFDDVMLEATPWARNVDGHPRTDIPIRLREKNPNIRLWLRMLCGDFWLPPTFVPQPTDHSGFRQVFDAIQSTNGWLYGIDGKLWYENYRVDLGNTATVIALTDIYIGWLKTYLFNGIFLDCCATSIAWTNGSSDRKMKLSPAYTVEQYDRLRWNNIITMISRIHQAGPWLVAINGTGPSAGQDIDFREGLGGLISENDATKWMETPGTHWMKAEAYTPQEIQTKSDALVRMAKRCQNPIICIGPDVDWPPVLIPLT